MVTELLHGSGEEREESLRRAAELIAEGELVAFPTETVYGLGALATSAEAVARVFEAKGRPSDNPLIVHLASADQIELYARLTERVNRVATAFMPGPLTIVLPSLENIPPIARAGLPTVALRVPDHQLALDLIARTGPLVAPSANRSGRPSPTRAQHVIDDLGGRIGAVLDGGQCAVGIESTVLDLSQREPRILRPGLITPEDLAPYLGVTPQVAEPIPGVEMRAPASPGTKYRHYAPDIPIRIIEIAENEEIEDIYLKLNFNPDLSPRFFCSSPEDLEFLHERHVDAVRLDGESLFSEFRRAEKEGIGVVLVLIRPDEVSDALMNRLQKASTGE